MKASLCSGGIESAVVLAMLREKYPREKRLAVYVRMGSKQERAELRASEALAKHYGAELCVAVAHIPGLSDHPLFSTGRFVLYRADKAVKKSKHPRAPGCYVVPYRNFVVLSVALSICGRRGADELWTGFDYERGVTSQDKSPAFVRAFQRAIREGGEITQQVRIVCPIQRMSGKTAVVRWGLAHKVPLHLSYSCYEGRDRACGVCSTCPSRMAAFVRNGTTDGCPYMTAPQLARYVGVTVARARKLQELAGSRELLERHERAARG